MSLLFILLVLHCLADYPLQGEYLAQAKNRHTQAGREVWWHALPAHSLIHGGCVFLATGSLWLGCAETVAHGLIDFLKCERRISAAVDQLLHVLCKCLWVLLAFEV